MELPRFYRHRAFDAAAARMALAGAASGVVGQVAATLAPGLGSLSGPAPVGLIAAAVAFAAAPPGGDRLRARAISLYAAAAAAFAGGLWLLGGPEPSLGTLILAAGFGALLGRGERGGPRVAL